MVCACMRKRVSEFGAGQSVARDRLSRKYSQHTSDVHLLFNRGFYLFCKCACVFEKTQLVRTWACQGCKRTCLLGLFIAVPA